MSISVPYTFVPATSILSAEVNANFSTLASAALARTGDTLTGNLAANAGVTVDGVDISAFLTSTRVLAPVIGSAAAPAFSMATDLNSGMYFQAADELAWSVGGSKKLELTSAGLIVTNDLYVGGALVSQAWPIGAVFIGVVSTNPNTLLGYGTWSAFGTGRTLVGLDSGQTEFDVVEETGGEKTHALITAELASHTHVQDAHNHTQTAHNHAIYTPNAGGGFNQLATSGGDGTAGNNLTGAAPDQNTTAVNVATTATNQTAGSGTAHNNLQPYIVVYFWKRTA